MEDFERKCDIGKHLRKINLEVPVEQIVGEITGGSQGWEVVSTWLRAAALGIEIAHDKHHGNRISLSFIVCLLFIHLFSQPINKYFVDWLRSDRATLIKKTANPSAWLSRWEGLNVATELG